MIAGPDPHDATAASEPVPDYGKALTGDIAGLRVGVPRSVLSEGVDDVVARAFDEALRVLSARGAVVVDVALPHAKYGIPIYYLIATAEASSNLARYDGVRYGYRAGTAKRPASRGASTAPEESSLRHMYERTRDEGFGAEVKRRIMLGTYVLSAGYYDAYYLKAQQVRTLLREDYERAWMSADVIAMPTTPPPAFRLARRWTTRCRCIWRISSR